MPHVVTAEQIARKFRMELPLTPEMQSYIEEHIEDAEGDVQGYLRRPLTARTETLEGLLPRPGGDLDDWKTWPQAVAQFDDHVTVDSYVVNAEDAEAFDVTFKVGLDVANDPELRPIKRWVIAAACEALRNAPEFAEAEVARRVRTVSADGQSVTYDTPSQSGGSDGGGRLPGAPPPIDTLSQWRRTSVYTRPRPPTRAWPYDYRLRF